MKRILFWLPRVLAILYIAFISIFALDVFGEPNWLLALFIHLIPSFILIALTIIAWKNGKTGGFLFIAAGFAMLIFTYFESLAISIPVIIIGMLFVGTFWKK